MRVPRIYNEERTFSLTSMLGKLDVLIQMNKIEPDLTLYTKVNSKWIKYLTIINYKTSRRKLGGKLHVIGLGNDL